MSPWQLTVYTGTRKRATGCKNGNEVTTETPQSISQKFIVNDRHMSLNGRQSDTFCGLHLLYNANLCGYNFSVS